jgi:hypothetical protein
MLYTRSTTANREDRGVVGQEQIDEEIDMDFTEEVGIREKALAVVRMLQMQFNVNPRQIDKKAVTFKFPSGMFLDRLRVQYKDIDELTWVKVLRTLKETPKLKFFYDFLMDVPFVHDGGSHMFFPELFPEDGRVLVETMVTINNPSTFYPDIPGIENRKWKIGERVYVPSEMADRFIAFKWLKKVD